MTPYSSARLTISHKIDDALKRVTSVVIPATFHEAEYAWLY